MDRNIFCPLALFPDGGGQGEAVPATIVSLSRDGRDKRDERDARLVYLVYLVGLVCPLEPRVRASMDGDARRATRGKNLICPLRPSSDSLPILYLSLEE
jgi:hypothetical protein